MQPLTSLACASVLVIATLGAAAADQPAAQAPDGTPAAARGRKVYLIGSLRIVQPRIEAADGVSDEASGYLTIENRSNAADRLTGATVEGAASVSLADAGSRPPAEGFVVPPNGKLTLKPGDARLVLHGLPDAGPNGAPVKGTVRFERSGSLPVSFLRDRGTPADDDEITPPNQKPVSLSQ